MKTVEEVWQIIRDEARAASTAEPVLASFYHAVVLNHRSLAAALSYHIAEKLHAKTVPTMLVREVFDEAYAAEPEIVTAAAADVCAHYDRDPACNRYVMPFLYFKGFQAVQAYRVGNWLWRRDRRSMALYLQNRIATAFDVDIHPAARLGSGIMVDHATGLVIGETAVVGNNVSILHSVTLGGCGNVKGDRHPTIGDWVLLSAGAKILGNIHVGEGARVAAGSLVLEDVPPHATVAGVPAAVVGSKTDSQPALEMNQKL